MTKPWIVTDPLQRVVAPLADGIAPDHEFQVVAPASKAEEGAASDVTGNLGYHSDKRIVRMGLFRWTASAGQTYLVAVLSYSFANANPPHCCSTLAKVLLVSENADRVLDVLGKAPNAFTTFTSIRFIHTDTTKAEKLMIGYDYSGAGSTGISSIVLDVEGQKLRSLIDVDTLVLYEAELENADVHRLTFDERRTIAARGRRFFFVKKSYVQDGKIFKTPIMRVVSYPTGTGLPLDWQ